MWVPIENITVSWNHSILYLCPHCMNTTEVVCSARSHNTLFHESRTSGLMNAMNIRWSLYSILTCIFLTANKSFKYDCSCWFHLPISTSFTWNHASLEQYLISAAVIKSNAPPIHALWTTLITGLGHWKRDTTEVKQVKIS